MRLALCVCLASAAGLVALGESPVPQTAPGGESFGCEANPTGDPIGGGPGYRDIKSGGDFTVRTVKVVRWLRNHLDLERDWQAAIARLSQIYQHL